MSPRAVHGISSETQGNITDRRGVGPVGAYPVVVAEDHRRTAEASDEPVADVLFRSQRSELTRKWNHLQPVDTERAEKSTLFRKRRQQTQLRGILLKYRTRMRTESNDHGVRPALTGSRDKLFHDRPMPEVDSVKKSSGNYSHLTSSKSCL